MNNEIKIMCQDILNQSEEERLSLGNEAVRNMVRGFRDLGLNVEKTYQLIQQLTRLFVSADGKCGQKEFEFYKAVTGSKISSDDFFDMTNYGKNEDFVDDIVDLMREADNKTRTATIIYGLALMCHDGTLTVDEQNIIDRLLA